VYGIDREAILARDMLGGQPPPGCRVLSGPFPAGSSSDDPLAYAYDTQIVPRPYEPRLAQTLVQVARREVQSARRAASSPDSPPAADPGDQRASGEDQAPAVEAPGQPVEPAPADKTEPLRLVLVHPAYETARLATESIAADLARVGVACTIQPLPPGATRPAHDEWDLLYADVVMQEPLVDARLLLARDGLAASDSPYVNLALQNLDQALSWRDARLRLRQLHRTTHDELTVIPLWQLTEYFAFRRGLRDVGSQLATLYQQIEQWQVSPDVGAP
jgi:ABC-type transport system substrate-binding protein